MPLAEPSMRSEPLHLCSAERSSCWEGCWGQPVGAEGCAPAWGAPSSDRFQMRCGFLGQNSSGREQDLQPVAGLRHHCVLSCPRRLCLVGLILSTRAQPEGGGNGREGWEKRPCRLVGMPRLTQPFTSVLPPRFVLLGGFLGWAGGLFFHFSVFE